MVAHQQRRVDPAAEAPQPAGRLVDKLVRDRVRDLAEDETRGDGQARALHRGQPALARHGPGDHCEQGEMRRPQGGQQGIGSGKLRLRVGIAGFGGDQAVHGRHQHHDVAQRQPDPDPAP